MTKFHFTKMHGAGNDYVYIDCVKQHCDFSEQQLKQLAVSVSDRHKGIGSDGLVLIMPSDSADFRMRMFNADGSEAQMCGNAARCVGKYVFEHGHTHSTSLSLETLAGIKHLTLHVSGGLVNSVTVNMGAPVILASNIHNEHELACINMGNPHAVMYVDNPAHVDIDTLGPEIEHLPCFPEKTNVEFVRVINRKEIDMRVWERGTGETLACGTGACAAAVAAIKDRLTESTVTLHLPGGDLQVTWDGQDVLLTGPAHEVFNGEYRF